MAAGLSAAPVLSTPDEHILEIPAAAETQSTLTGDALRSVYEISRTATELRAGGWKRISLQFPDDMLVDAPWVAEALGSELADTACRVYVLADTSYSACCVDEIAAEHVDADVVVHYGRACLSPTSRLPVIYVYTSRELDQDAAVERFAGEFSDKDSRVVIMADLMYQGHVEGLVNKLRERGYVNVVGTEVVRDPVGLIPNRRIQYPGDMDKDTLQTHALFHISDPPSSVLLALHSRVASLHVLSTTSHTTPTIENPTARTAGLIRRRFASVLSLASAGVIGILVNTLSVANSVASIDALRRRITAADKKSYVVVVGRLNPAKLANFAEIEGWVIVGCWESGLVGEDQESGYWRPVVTPFEMEVALMPEEERVWGGEWWGGIEKLKLEDEAQEIAPQQETTNGDDGRIQVQEDPEEEGVEGDESLPPVFDLRTGKLVSHSRPMRLATRNASSKEDEGNAAGEASETLIKRSAPGELASINGVASPGAEFLRSQRTWQGLGSDFAETNETSAVIEEGRSGIARGYHVGDQVQKH